MTLSTHLVIIELAERMAKRAQLDDFLNFE